MILTLFGVLFALALFLIILGMVWQAHSEQALIGFSLLFILGIIILNSNLEYQSGSNVTSAYTYDALDRVNGTEQIISNQYTKFSDSTSHQFGLWLSVTSFFGFFGVLWSMKKANIED